jgi:hypothetical protein
MFGGVGYLVFQVFGKIIGLSVVLFSGSKLVKINKYEAYKLIPIFIAIRKQQSNNSLCIKISIEPIIQNQSNPN